MHDTTLRKLQLVQLEIAKEIKKVCEENDIRYWLDSGSLLGAVRHKGFIPWDDDMDIGMLREDYEKFLLVAPYKLPEKYMLLDWETEKEYPHPFCKVVKKGTVCLEETEKGNLRKGIYVDIFPYDHYPIKRKDQYIQNILIMSYRVMLRAKCHLETWKLNDRFYLGRWMKNLPFRLASCFISKKSLIKKYKRIAIKYNPCKCEFYFSHGFIKYGKWLIPKKCFQEYIFWKFEDTLFCVPAAYDIYLKQVYGDYMKLPPKSKRKTHGIIQVDFGREE